MGEGTRGQDLEDEVDRPVDGDGDQELIRSLIRTQRPDMVWFMTDPRFYDWLWMMENEIRPLCPMVYYHVWDNFPAPMFNRDFYLSNDHIVTISKVTDDIVKEVAPEVGRTYIPHAVDPRVFKPFPEQEIEKIKQQLWTSQNLDPDRFTVFWNNRNARRKQSGTLVYWFKAFLDNVGHDKARLLMHTDPKDPHGQDLPVLIERLGMTPEQVMLSTEKLPPEHLSAIYNAVDVTVNISDAEGFGLSTLESLSCGTPIIVNMTGGLQEQVTDGEEWFGIGLEPCSKAIIGSQEIPYIREDRLNKEASIIFLLDQLDDPQNVGAIFRSALAFDIDGIILTDHNSVAENSFLAKTASSAIDKVPFTKIQNISSCVKILKDKGYWIYGLDMKAQSSITDIKFPNKIVFVLGSESKGMRRVTSSLCDENLKIKISDNLESLNVSNTAAIMMFYVSNINLKS